ncbi:MAG: aspartate kinase [Lentisphaerae bacterium RIFOXYC12_FULL_60_16]|nr:MAG: aspartate kinase [Lentisphaerae bacterium RIFOXYC12_FULL_60_16]OGV73898.1 MAG: aspartate kinase [Lentisphaerae bacterium RIFOXYA12_FULL_60_10]OGV86649.1 MAG: aspartate kinase [Lentisphaerae bacterium RIFOXYB12_FULL_60_10]
MKVCKFGGSSLADAAQVTKVRDIVLADPDRRLVVVSAPGKRNKADTKVTDLLIAAAEARLAGGDGVAETARVVDRYAGMVRDLKLGDAVLGDITADLNRCVASDRSHRGRYLDRVKAAGEDNSARLMAAVFRAAGADASYVSPKDAGLLLSDEFGNARVLPESYARLESLKRRRGIVVFPGFFGMTPGGDVATFPRGGSDITGSILAAAVRADVYENFTDVDHVYSTDPRVVPGATPIHELTYREMRELSYAGFGVFHDEAVVPAVEAGIPICIRNTNRPDAPGTWVKPERKFEPGRVVGIACGDGFATVFVSKYLMNREVGFGRRLLQIFEDEGLSYEHIPSGIDNLSVILREGVLAPKEAHVIERIRTELGATDIEVERGLALIMIVGEGMRYTVGLAARATRTLADAGVNIEMLNQGSSEISMMFGVKSVDAHKAVRALYREFFPTE